MKKLILFIVALTLPILSQADPNPDDSTRVLWKVDPDYMVFWTPMYFSADGNFILNSKYREEYDPYKKIDTIVFNHIQKRSVETGEIVKEVDVGTPSRFRDLQLTPDGQYLIVAKSTYFAVQIRDANTLELIREIEIPNAETSEEEPFKWILSLTAARLLPDNNTVAVNVSIDKGFNDNGNTILLYDFQTGEYLDEIIVNNRDHYIDNIRATTDGKFLFTYPEGIKDSIYVIDLDTKNVVRSHESMTKTLEDFALSPDGLRYMYSSNISPNIYIYETYGSPFPKEIDYRGGGVIRDIGFIENSPYILFDSGKESDGLILYNYETEKDYSLGVNIYGKPTFRNEDNLLLSNHASHITLSYLNIPQITSISEPKDVTGTIYPNPGENEITLEFSLEEPGTGEILLFDSIGNEIEMFGREFFNAGINRLPLNISQYAAGTYIIKVKTESEIITFKMIKR